MSAGQGVHRPTRIVLQLVVEPGEARGAASAPRGSSRSASAARDVPRALGAVSERGFSCIAGVRLLLLLCPFPVLRTAPDVGILAAHFCPPRFRLSLPLHVILDEAHLAWRGLPACPCAAEFCQQFFGGERPDRADLFAVVEHRRCTPVVDPAHLPGKLLDVSCRVAGHKQRGRVAMPRQGDVARCRPPVLGMIKIGLGRACVPARDRSCRHSHDGTDRNWRHRK